MSTIEVKKEFCEVCGKTVYPTEATKADGKVWHKSCFRCKVCNNVLKLGSYASLDSVYYCKPHFKQLFATKGNYSEGFGKLKPQHEFDVKKGNTTVEDIKGNGSVEEVTQRTSAVSFKEPEQDNEGPAGAPAEEANNEGNNEEEQAQPEEPSQIAESETEEPSQSESNNDEPTRSVSPVKEELVKPTTAAAPSPTPSPRASFGSPSTLKLNVGKNKCEVCSKTVYAQEAAQGIDKTLHKTCFRCTHCNNVLKLGNFASMDNVYYCKTHFKQLFKSKGNYSEGFGKLKPQHEFNLKSGKTAASTEEADA